VGVDGFVIGSALTGKLVSLFDYRAILLMLSLGVASMLLGMLLKPSVMPQGSLASRKGPGWRPG
jgi:PPP family 3-phenylpropionic acid transporter